MTINDQLILDGWKTFSSWRGPVTLAFAKSFEGHCDCKCNQRGRKQIEIYYNPEQIVHGHTFKERWSVELVGQLPDNEWLRMQVESLSDIKTIYRTVETLLTIWDNAVFLTPYIEEQ